MAAVLDQHSKLKPKPLETLTPAEARKQPTPADAVKRLALKPGEESPAPEPVGKIADSKIPGVADEIKVRVYTPKGEGPFPVVLYFHGGGWVIADLDTYDASGRALTNAARAVVVSVHYRQAPEHRFPASHDDAVAAYKWVLGNQEKLNGNGQVAVAGESAGGNLAASLCLMARDQGLPPPVHQLLIYPVTDTKFDTASYRENAQAKPLNKATMEWFFKHEADAKAMNDPRLAILRADNLRGLPSATVITAQIDPLRSEGEAYANKLKGAGVAVAYRNFDGVTHEFFGMGAVVQKAKAAQAFAGDNLRRAFETGAGAATGRTGSPRP